MCGTLVRNVPASSLQYAQDMFDGLFQTADSLANQVSAASTRCSHLLQVRTVLFQHRVPSPSTRLDIAVGFSDDCF